MRLVTSLALSGCAVAALSACTAATDPPAASPAATAAAPGPSAPPSEPPAASAPTPPASSTTTPASAVEPVAGRPAWKTVDFAKASYRHLGRCPHTAELPDTAEISGVHLADVTGDGVTDAIVAASCRTTTASNPISVLLYDGTDRKAPLTRLGAIGTGQYLTTADVGTKGRTITVVSEALSDRAPRCCPDLLITQTYRWSSGELRRTSIDEAPINRDR